MGSVEVKYKSQTNSKGERISSNGYYTGHKLGTPTQCAIANMGAYEVEENLTVRNNQITQDAAPNSMPELIPEEEETE